MPARNRRVIHPGPSTACWRSPPLALAMSLPFPRLANMSAPPRTTVTLTNRVAPSRFLRFSLASLWPEALELKHTPAWDQSIFQSGLPHLPDRQAVHAAAALLPGFLIASSGRPEEPATIVRDAALVIALLSRRVDHLFIKARQPDDTLARLLENDFCVEDWGLHEDHRKEPP